MTTLAHYSAAAVPIQDTNARIQLNGVGFMAATCMWLAVLVWLVYWVG
jgi:hypothetical protein